MKWCSNSFSKAVFVLSAALLARTTLSAKSDVIANFGHDFVWGVASAPAQSEDQLDDSWLDFAQRGLVHAWNNTENPEDRLQFWTKPEVELDLAQELGMDVYRMGVDWGRLVPNQPYAGEGVQDKEALARYKEIVKMVRARGMKVMMTLFHHSAPKWSPDAGGWVNPEMATLFSDFAADVIRELGDDVEYWVTFNEPTVFVMFTHCSGMWPPGKEESSFDSLKCIFPIWGDFHKAMASITDAHHRVYDLVKESFPAAKVGVAHNIGVYDAATFLDKPTAWMIEQTTLFPFTDGVSDAMDFCGLNYYGKEITKGMSVAIADGVEYSESGRSVYPNGIYELLVRFHERYHKKHNFNYMITENGVSDKTDILRPAYLVEHLMAVRAAMDEGVPVEGFIQWSLSDNNEWVDGYCPGFGLVAVDRTTMHRIPRPSFYLYQDIVRSGQITQTMRSDAWEMVTTAAENEISRPFCRSLDGKTSVDEPYDRLIQKADWRFAKN